MVFVAKFLDFISPRFCTSCKCVLNVNENFICSSCFNQITELSSQEIETEYERKFSSSVFIDNYSSLFKFEEKGKIQDLIHALKYNQKFKVGIFLGNLIGKKKKDLLKSWKIDFIVPIPLFHLKKIDRGYNQADYIGKGLSKALAIKLDVSIAKRIKNTQSQTKLNTDERAENMSDAFKIKKGKKVVGKNILIVDDVITTGITVLELAKKLKEKGAAKVFCLSIATPLISHTFGSSNTQN
jgi:ComF family protein